MSSILPDPHAPIAASEEGFTARMIRLWIEHYERVLGFYAGAR